VEGEVYPRSWWQRLPCREAGPLLRMMGESSCQMQRYCSADTTLNVLRRTVVAYETIAQFPTLTLHIDVTVRPRDVLRQMRV
jgi:hypothetical protein